MKERDAESVMLRSDIFYYVSIVNKSMGARPIQPDMCESVFLLMKSLESSAVLRTCCGKR